MRNYLKLSFIVVLSSLFTLVAYRFFIEQPEVLTYESQEVLENHQVHNNALYKPVDFTHASEKTLNSVVHVKNKSIYTTRNPLEQMMFGPGHKRIQIGTGSGVIISSDGYIVTNNHVISGANELEITLNNKKTYPAKLIGIDKANDIALIKVDATDLPYITFADSDNLKVGEWVLAVGNPYNLTSTVTAGIVSAKGRDLLGSGMTESYIQTDAVVNSGNSGGALVNANGELIGINTMITSTTGSYIGYSFAVPSNIARKVVDDLMEFGNVKRAYVGISFRELTGKNYQEFGVSNTEGVIIVDVLKGTGAEKAGIQPSDIIVKVDRVKVSTFADLNGYLNTKRPNEIVKFTVIRDGREKVIPVELFEREDYY